MLKTAKPRINAGAEKFSSEGSLGSRCESEAWKRLLACEIENRNFKRVLCNSIYLVSEEAPGFRA